MPEKEEKQHYQTRRRELVLLMAEGHTYEAATSKVGQLLGHTMARRLLRRYQKHGEVALKDGRQGHPSKFRLEIQKWLNQSCTQHPTISSRQLQNLLLTHFELKVSVSQINRVRAALHLTRQADTPVVDQTQTDQDVKLTQIKKK